MKVLNFKENLRRIEKIKAMQDMQTSRSVYFIDVNEDGTITEGSNVYESLNDIKSPWFDSEKSRIFLEDFVCVPDGIYLPDEPLLWWVTTSAERKVFIDLSLAKQENEWMQLYIQLIKKSFNLVSKDEFSFGRLYSEEEKTKKESEYIAMKRKNACEVLEELDFKNTALEDLIWNFDTYSVEELVERYKDHQKWFTGNKYK